MADLPRFFIAPEDIASDEILLTADTLHHLRTVLRLKNGDEAVLLDGAGTCCHVRFVAIKKDLAIAEPLSRWHTAETALPIRLQQAVPKGDKFDLVLQKGTELGITCFQPIFCQRSISQTDAERLRKRRLRWKRIISEAARQSHRCTLPVLEEACPLEAAVYATPDHLRLAFWEEGAISLKQLLPEDRPATISLLVGPEGGFTSEEMALARQAGYQPVHLGPRILRTETAGLAAASILQYLYGDLSLTPKFREGTP